MITEAVIVRIVNAALHDSAYEQMQHAGEVRKVGWSEAEVEAIKAGDVRLLPDETAAVLAFVDQAVSMGQVTDVTFARACREG